MTAKGGLYGYVGVVFAAALGLVAAFTQTRPVAAIPPQFAMLLLAGMGLIVAGGYCWICVGRNVAVNMASTVIFAMTLLLPPSLAAVGTALGVGLLYTLMRWPTLYVVFNMGQSALTVAATSVALGLLGAPSSLTQFGPSEIAAAVGAAGVFFLVNSVTVTAFAVLHGEATFVAHWRQAFGRSAVPYFSTLLVGIVVAVTYVHAPVATPILILPTIAIYRALRDATVLRKQTQETMEFLTDIMDGRDHYTHEHSQRVAGLAKRMAARLGLPDDVQAAIAQAARVHDLGKLGIADGLLHKPDKLTRGELDEVRKHTVIGAEIVGKLPEYARGKEYILFHHEHYDGSGAFRLYGTHIPLGARIISVADAFDAMTSDRPYRAALTLENALAEIARGSGTQFDPVVAQALISIVQEETGRVPHAVPAAVPAATQPTVT